MSIFIGVSDLTAGNLSVSVGEDCFPGNF